MLTRPPAARPRLGLSEEAPTGRRALAFGVLWLAVAVFAAWAAVWIAVHLTSSAPLRIVVALVLVALCVAALMLASDSVERWLAGRFSGWGGPLQWLTTSVAALAVVVVLGAPVTLLAPDRPGASNVALDFVIDFFVGVIAGAVAVGVILVLTARLGHAIWWVQRQLGVEQRAERWRPPARANNRVLRDLLRGAVLGAAGLMLSALATSIITTATTNHTAAVDTPAQVETSVLLTVVLPALIWFAGTGIVWLLFSQRQGDVLKPHRPLRHGTHASALAICLVIGAVWIAAAGVEGQARGDLWSGKAGTVPTVSVTDQQASRQSAYLAQQFEPQVWLAKGERWSPTAVTWYVKQNPKPNTDPPFCNAHMGGQPPPGCYQIPPACDDADPGPCAVSGANDPALYYRYADAGNGRSAPGTGGALTLIQYWFFYNYDSLHTFAVTQWHQSDWEQVSVLVQRNGSTVRPVEVAFSEHCYGAVVPAERVHWVNGSHPVDFVGRGSHANYPRSVGVPVRQLRCSLGVTPRYLGVAGLFFSPAVDGSRLEIPVAYLIGLRDDARGVRRQPTLRLLSLATAHDILAFDGNWGLDNNLSPLQVGRLRSSAGPLAPQEQGPWRTPLPSMLCNGHWLSTRSVPRSETASICASR